MYTFLSAFVQEFLKSKSRKQRIASDAVIKENALLSEISVALGIPFSQINSTFGFIQHGGHSISAAFLISAFSRRGFTITMEAILRSRKISDILDHAIPNCLMPRIPETSRALEEHQISHQSRDRVVQAEIGNFQAQNRIFQNSNIPWQGEKEQMLTEMQLSLIYGTKKQPGTNFIHYYEFHLPASIPRLKKAWKTIITSEPIFKTVFPLDDPHSESIVAPSFRWTEVTVDSQQAYDTELTKDYPEVHITSRFRVITLRSTEDRPGKSAVIWHIHHALVDGYSAQIILSKIRQLTAGHTTTPGPSFLDLASQLNDFRLRWLDTGRSYWKRQSELFPSSIGDLRLPPPSINHSKQPNRSRSIIIELPIKLGVLQDVAKNNGITLPSIYAAAWALTLRIYMNAETVVFGVVFSGRNIPLAGITETVGPLMNVMPLNIGFDPDSRTENYLNTVFSSMIELSTFQWTQPVDGFTRNFQSILAMQFEEPEVGAQGILPIEKPYNRVVSDIPLRVVVEPDGTIDMQYHTAAFEHDDIESLGAKFQQALLALLRPDNKLSDCIASLNSEESILYELGNCNSINTTPASVHEDLVNLFESAVRKFPGNLAVEKGAMSINYEALDNAACVLANQLTTFVKPGNVVCVHADRSINWIVAIYGILKVGGVYCPLDESLPSQIRESNFRTSTAKIFLTPSATAQKFVPASCENWLAVEDVLLASQDQTSGTNFPKRVWPQPKTGAYLCFTSGSSGQPKGVLCRHEGIVAFHRDITVRLFAQSGRRISQLMNPGFDGSIAEIFSALSYGATLVLGDAINPLHHLKSVDSAILTPSIAQILNPKDFPRLSTVYLVGEPVSQTVNDRWASEKILYNMYGPTEATCGATIKRLLPFQQVTIGSPNPSSRIYILSNCRSLVPRGVIGEIYIAGVQVSTGYIGRDEETANSFFPDSICSGHREMMYKTGDYGYWNRQGEIVCIGRCDRQIKLRGFRVDLDDIEIRMLKADSSATAVAVARTSDYLVAMVQPSTIDISHFKSMVEEILPAHAVPRNIKAVDDFPTTTAGKLNYRAIEQSFIGYIKGNLALESLDRAESEMIAIWREILELDPSVLIHGDSNFMDLGGNSLLQLRLSNKLAQVYKQRVPLCLILMSPTLKKLVERLKSSKRPADDMSATIKRSEDAISPIEKEWYMKYQSEVGTSSFNVNFICKLGPKINKTRLGNAWNLVLDRHRILRSRYMKDSQGQPYKAYSKRPPRTNFVDHIEIAKEVNRPFKVEVEDPIRVFLAKDLLAVIVSHIVCDLTTLNILLRDVALTYDNSPLDVVKKTYLEASFWDEMSSLEDLEFWSRYLYKPLRNHICSATVPRQVSFCGTSKVSQVPKGLFHAMASFSKEHKLTFHQLSLAAVALTLQRNRPLSEIALGAPYLNRSSEDDFRIAGLFLEPLPIRIHYPLSGSQNLKHNIGSKQQDALSFLHAVRESSQSSLMHAVPWNQLVEHLKKSSGFSEPIIDTMVTFHEYQEAAKLSLPDIKPLYAWSQGAKFELLVEFTAINADVLMLRLEYNNEYYAERQVALIQRCINKALEELIKGSSYPDMTARISELEEIEVRDNDSGSGETFFGIELNSF